MARHYLDHASTTPLRPAAGAAMSEWISLALEGLLGDPGRVHQEALTARPILEDARDQVADLVGATPREVVFTSSATEAITAAIFGAAGRGGHQVVSSVEHSSVSQAADRHAAAVTVVRADQQGRVAVDDMLEALRPETSLVTIQWGNHEVGTLQPIAELSAALQDLPPLLHIDAAQAVGHVPVSFQDLGADLLSLSGHKFGGPPGTGVLLIKRGLRIDPLLVGSAQERLRRAGFENALGAVGLGAACEALTPEVMALESTEARGRTARIIEAAKHLPGIHIYGDPDNRLPHIVCLGIDDVEPQAVVLGLDQQGIAVHSGSSCASEELEPSPVLAAMGVDADHSLRISVGWSTTDADIDALLKALPEVLAHLRALRPGNAAG